MAYCIYGHSRQEIHITPLDLVYMSYKLSTLPSHAPYFTLLQGIEQSTSD